MDRSQLVRSRLGAAGFAGGEASRCEPASCCKPAAMSNWQIAEWLVGGYAPGRSAAPSAHATRGALSGQHSRAAESRVGVLRPSHSSPRAAAVDSSSLTAKVTMVLHTTPGCEERSRQLEKLALFATKSENASPRDTGVTRSRVPGAMRMCEGGWCWRGPGGCAATALAAVIVGNGILAW